MRLRVRTPALGRSAVAVALLLVLAACGGAAGAPPDGATPPAAGLPPGDDRVVERIVDGDTLVVDGGERVRLIGVDTPESVHPSEPDECFGEEAARHLRRLVPAGTAVRLSYDVERTDRYGRTLAYVWRLRDGLHVNRAMVADGYAQVYTVPPNVRYAEEYLAAQRAARDAGAGLWGACPAG